VEENARRCGGKIKQIRNENVKEKQKCWNTQSSAVSVKSLAGAILHNSVQKKLKIRLKISIFTG
jgi:hypothetical protein